MRILYLGWANHIHVSRWAECFAEKGHKVWVLSGDRATISGVKVIRSLTSHLRYSRQAKELRFYKKFLKIDIVHAHWASFGYLPALAKLHPYVVTAWGSDIYRFNEYDEETQNMLRTTLQNADLITVNSIDLKKTISHMGINPDNIHIIQWGVDTELFKPGLDTKELKDQLDIQGKRIIYSPRNIGNIYNNDIILHAFKEVLEKYQDTVLIQICYHTPESNIKEFIELAKQLKVENQVIIVRNKPYNKIPLLYNIADVVVSVPSSDATSMSMLEAMACGSILIVSDLPSLREWIQDGKNGFLIPDKDSNTLAKKIIYILENRHKINFCIVNREIIKNRADQQTNMEMMEKLYTNLLKQTGTDSSYPV